MKYLWVCFFCLFITPAIAAQQMRDFSMPVGESLKDSGNAPSKPNTGLNNNYQPARDPSEDEFPSLQQQPSSKGSPHFMDHYCDPAVKIGIVKTSISSCINEKRKAACDEYAAMPNDVRSVLNLEIDCKSAEDNVNAWDDENDDAQEGGVFSSRKAPATPSGCDMAAEKRIELLKKYHGDAYTTHALLFLPDMALKSNAQCISGR